MCLSPFEIKKESGGTMPVPCGKCPECRERRLSQWAFRIMQEEKICNSAKFITLTYGTNHIPITGQRTLSLRKRDLQLFFKRLRKKHDMQHIVGGIKYYAVGEYGPQTVRPHYHLLLFNAKIEFICDAWGKGHVHYGEVTPASIRYTLDYMSKQKPVHAYPGDEWETEYFLMSKGLGANYLNEKMINWHHADILERCYSNLPGNEKVAMPRYYKNKLYTKLQRSSAGVYLREESLKRKSEELEKQIKVHGSYSAAEKVRIERDNLKIKKMNNHEKNSKI